MRATLVHTDLRLYWPARLGALRDRLAARGDDLLVIEIAGRGSPYAFASPAGKTPSGWTCLFPERAMEDVASAAARAAVWAALDDRRPDVVLAGALAFPSGANALAWCRRHGRGFVLMDNARRVDVPRSRLTNWVKRRLHRLADAALLPSTSLRSDYEWWGVHGTRQYYGVNAIDNRFFSERADRARPFAAQRRRELGLPESFVLGVGRQIAKKRWQSLIEAHHAFRRAGGTWGLVLVGSGPERPMLERRAAELSPGAVVFVDFVTPERLAAYYALAETLVLPSGEGETWGNVVNEAMASGLPVLVSRACGCASTLVAEGENGWTFESGDVEDLARRLLAMFRLADDERRRMGQRSQEIVSHWGLDRFATAALAAIDQAARGPHPRAGVVDRVLMRLWRGRYRPT